MRQPVHIKAPTSFREAERASTWEMLARKGCEGARGCTCPKSTLFCNVSKVDQARSRCMCERLSASGSAGARGGL